MERSVLISQLQAWKNQKRRKPLLVRGARQVGKTYTVKQFGREQFENLLTIDLEKNSHVHQVFEGSLDATRICSDLEVLLGAKITPGTTLLFFDEIQACPRALLALRYFYEEMPELHVIGAGSLLEFALADISFPVGRIQFLDVYPMSFAEYLIARGKQEAANIVLLPPQKLSLTVHQMLLDELRQFFFIGGMPESVRAFVESGSMQESFNVQREICETYKNDFSKYRPQVAPECIITVWESVAKYVAQQVKYTHLADGYSQPTLKSAFEVLSCARLVKKISSTNPAGLPLGASLSSKIFKAIVVDIGIMQSLSGMSVAREYLEKDLLDMYRGRLAEQFVGQEMLISQQANLYYWARKEKSSIAEVDYLAVIDGKIYPVEVKSKAAGHLKSLHLCLQTYQNCPHGLVFSTQPYEHASDKKLAFLPLYYAFSATGGGNVEG